MSIQKYKPEQARSNTAQSSLNISNDKPGHQQPFFGITLVVLPMTSFVRIEYKGLKNPPAGEPVLAPRDIKRPRSDMNKPQSKRRAVGLLLVLGGILALIAIWDLP
jgi:hypothetical protein